MQRDDVIQKVRKLLALASGNANKNEAVAAALKAQKLMADYDVEVDEVAGEEASREPVEVRTEAYARGDWRGWLASAIADNFRCRSYRHWRRKARRNLEHEQVFVGYELDARAAAMTYERLAEVGERLAREECARYRRVYGEARGVKNTFLLGFVNGVRSELEKQSQALMLVCPKEVEEYYDNLKLRKGRAVRISLEHDARAAGASAGHDAVRAGRIGASDAHLLASA